MIRVLVVESSPSGGALLFQVLESDPEIVVVGQARTGEQAVRLASRVRPDLITLDVDLPTMDGVEVTRRIMSDRPTPILVVSPDDTEARIEMSLRALRAGALMVVRRPTGRTSPRFAEDSEQLLSMIKAMAEVRVVRRRGREATHAVAKPLTAEQTVSRVRIVAIGTSTGGPAALRRTLSVLPDRFPVPVVVVQHMARGFTPGLASWLDGECRLRVKVAEDGEALRDGTVYLAPEDRHLGVSGSGHVRLEDSPPIAGFRPSASHLFASVAASYGAGAVGVILTGMGRDGVEGLEALHERGGLVLAQDGASSVVYGMAQEAVRAGVVDAILPLEKIGGQLLELTAGDGDEGTHTRR